MSTSSAGPATGGPVRTGDLPTQRIPAAPAGATGTDAAGTDAAGPDRTNSPAGRHRHDGGLAPAESRGELTMADRVVEKIAATALAEIAEIGGSARRMLGVPLGSDAPDHRPRVDARIAGQLVALDVTASVAYPAPVARVAERARAHVAARVGELTGLRTQRVDITVTALTVPAPRQGRVL